jgi:pimeloyl-ACP methyl ester carboxylesterase
LIPDYIAASGLARNILRDSCDPGAADVIASGAKLPPPATMNSLLDVYRGPVLLAQGALDPLNDAVARAGAFRNVRAGVSVELLPLGHCPFDEDGPLVGDAVVRWAEANKFLAEREWRGFQASSFSLKR